MTLEQLFATYIELVSRTVANALPSKTSKGKLQLVAKNKAELRTLIDQVERGREFEKLVAQTSSSFSKDYHGKSKTSWEHAVQNFFRRSDYYLDVWNRRAPDKDLLFKRYCEAFEGRHTTTTYLGLLEYVRFAEDCIDLGKFQIRRFKPRELHKILQTRVNEVFFPWAMIDVDRLTSYWFIYLEEQIPTPQMGKIPINLNEIGRLRLNYTAYPKAVELALYPLALFGWETDFWNITSSEGQTTEEKDLDYGWNAFHVPWVIRLHDHLLLSPSRGPDVSRLETVPNFDPYTNEEIGDTPLILADLNRSGTELLKRFVKNTGDLLADIATGSKEWRFFETALGYFVKAFCSEGFEQLLWHITTLEALLGERSEGLTEKLARRISAILGNTNQGKKALNRQFKDLYDFRSTLVHGGNFKKQVYLGHLREARSLARKVLLWFLHFLKFQRGISEGRPQERLLTRQEILTIMDIDCEDRARLAHVMGQLPETFPYVPQWTEQVRD